ncbi:MAG TPA: carboxymuconolactone decarboxylase family protein [Kofleriaceae bacterium]|nr:carboxymuconolactone decarboxylase family protein [Kofleriaceae bacterium]
MKTTIALAITTIALSFAGAVHADPPSDAKATYKDVEKTLNFVPAFMHEFPESEVAAVWSELKTVQMNPSTALPMKTKELIGLAVAAQIPCRYCTYFHTQVAKLGGASDEDEKEAIAMAGLTRHWSAVANGMQIDFSEFKQEIARIGAYLKHPTATGDAQPVVDAASAYRDIERTLGSVPTFMRRFPEAGIAAAWSQTKSLELNPATSLDGKTKELIGLAVASQIPCQYCIYFHTAAAQLYGASDEEIREAVAMSAITRDISTVLNGNLTDEVQFRKDVDQIVVNVKKSAKR